MIDGRERKIDYIRISITDQCNLRCNYCMPDERNDFLSKDQLLTVDEITTIMKILAKKGVTKIKITGGEPTVRKDLLSIVKSLHSIDGIEDITLTTNGVRLKELVGPLVKAGITAINISLDTLDEAKYQEITNCDKLDRVLEGIKEALNYPNLKLKINCVPIDSDNHNFTRITGLAKDYPICVRFIEMMPIGCGCGQTSYQEEEMKELLEREYGPMTIASQSFGNGPARYYSIDGFLGKVGFISAISHKFCDSCNRIRLTCDGEVKTCLQYKSNLNLRDVLRNGGTEEKLESLLMDEIKRKPEGHHFNLGSSNLDENKIMGSIGG